MGKRAEIRARRKKQRMRRRIFIVVMMVAGALLIAAALILPSLLPGNSSTAPDGADLVVVTPRSFDMPVNGQRIGDPDAPVTVEVWADFQCPSCAGFSINIEAQIINTYAGTGQVLFTFHQFPFIDGWDDPQLGDSRLHYISSEYGFGESDRAANASMCASEQGRFWDYHDMLYANWNGENEGTYSDELMIAIAESLDLNMQEFEACYHENTYDAQIQQDFLAGFDIGVDYSTPSIFVNGEKIYSSKGERYVPSFEDVAAAIEAALAGE